MRLPRGSYGFIGKRDQGVARLPMRKPALDFLKALLEARFLTKVLLLGEGAICVVVGNLPELRPGALDLFSFPPNEC